MKVSELEGAGKFVPENTAGDVFENAIRKFGVVAACEWFGYRSDSYFTKGTIRILDERLRESHGESVGDTLPTPPIK